MPTSSRPSLAWPIASVLLLAALVLSRQGSQSSAAEAAEALVSSRDRANRLEAYWLASWASGDTLSGDVRVREGDISIPLRTFAEGHQFVLLMRDDCEARILVDDMIRDEQLEGQLSPLRVLYRLDDSSTSDPGPVLELPPMTRPTPGVPTLVELNQAGMVVGVAHASAPRVLRRLESAGVLRSGAASRAERKALASASARESLNRP